MPSDNHSISSSLFSALKVLGANYLGYLPCKLLGDSINTLEPLPLIRAPFRNAESGK
jgi:threonine/homoserine/homoserine lactone efflux protein